MRKDDLKEPRNSKCSTINGPEDVLRRTERLPELQRMFILSEYFAACTGEPSVFGKSAPEIERAYLDWLDGMPPDLLKDFENDLKQLFQ
ncbi:MAG: hypothetical protein KKB37_13200 [Alphaproteobacteria bacterium]|nr:hypothetical protein [Alphaproteobacteria bacterium]